MQLSQAQATADEIVALYEKHGHEMYGEEVSQLQHACQSAQWARQAQADEEAILAAFLHDIGHLLESAAPQMGTQYGRFHHEAHGGLFLRQKGFSEKIAQLVESHVAAKRYLTYKDAHYFAQLSEASRQTLYYQGGPMSAAEATAFEASDYFELKIQLRYWDEQAKESNVPAQMISDIWERMVKHLNHSPHTNPAF